MSQRTVELVIGRLLTDEELRQRFARDPIATLADFCERGFELTRGEIDALLHIDAQLWGQTAERIHPRLQRSSLRAAK
jgi:hypothetical protein